MKLLALETSTEACSAALYVDGEVSERYEVAPRQHAQLILPMMDALLLEADIALTALDGIAYGRGPGAFTGVRIATSVVQGIAYGVELPVAPVSSLLALAQGVYREHGAQRVLAAIDARMSEVYWASCVFDGNEGVMRLADAECVCSPAQLPLPHEGLWCGAGSGWSAYQALIMQQCAQRVSHVYTECFPRARDVANLGAAMLRRGIGVRAHAALPVYLRDKVANKAHG